MKGTASETFWKSSRSSATPTERAIAIRCSTALVEPPSAITVTIAFRKAGAVMMADGRRSDASSSRMAAPAAKHSSTFSCELAGLDDE